MIWRIDDFENKMKESVENKTALFSPKFYSHEYGYALQVNVYNTCYLISVPIVRRQTALITIWQNSICINTIWTN